MAAVSRRFNNCGARVHRRGRRQGTKEKEKSKGNRGKEGDNRSPPVRDLSRKGPVGKGGSHRHSGALVEARGWAARPIEGAGARTCGHWSHSDGPDRVQFSQHQSEQAKSMIHLGSPFGGREDSQ
ncbi:hypothetical protein NDU88_006251 [Pleurodeles waltl]|uniref:Uncharacterized protein n=1 Tax=Pleurodeles waltl TaxID=8319 RepID=A0AAV7MZV9_PLEWA|nr:hypothetical protein NDU88_006251 [Pleurodeles waltl]